jgi:pyruvate/2-oxoglutarate dehydrogenase complex dihydrolipoamide dehydrogenase (E3) component
LWTRHPAAADSSLDPSFRAMKKSKSDTVVRDLIGADNIGSEATEMIAELVLAKQFEATA